MHTFTEISDLIQKRIDRNDLFPKTLPGLYDPCQYLICSKGKRIRPALCIMAFELFGQLNDDAYKAALSLELFHNFTLIHDDIMDNAPLRRGLPTIHEKYGLASGILCGDVMSIYAYQLLTTVNPEMLSSILPIFNKMAIEVCEGQQMDMEFEFLETVTSKMYMDMIESKTASLLATSLQIGALLGGADKTQSEKLYEAGRTLGIAFQLQDDYLDAFGDPNQTGKQPGGDIIEKKRTMLYIWYQDVASYNARSVFNELYMGDEEGKVPEVIDMLKKAEVDGLVLEGVNHYSNLAFQQLHELGLPEERLRPIMALFHELLHRKS